MPLQGFDATGNRSPTLELNYLIDVRPPQLAITERLATTAVSNTLTSVLTGTAVDGSGMPTVTVRLISPSEPAQLLPAQVDGERWTFAFTPEDPGLYQLIIEGQDQTGNLRILPSVSVTATKALLSPPGTTGQPATASTQILRQFVPGLKQGGFIKLAVEPGLLGLWSRVQWRDASGRWHEVDGWQGTYYRDNEVLWWVSISKLGTGPYRWVLSERPGGPTECPLLLRKD